MGLFDFFKKQSIDLDHLPENDQELKTLYDKYVYNNDEKSKKICQSIIFKAYELYKDKNDLSHWAVRKYCLIYGTKEEKENYYNYEAKRSFDKYIEELDSFILSSSLSSNELLDKCPTFLSNAGDKNAFVYYENPDHYKQYLSNALYKYYTDHLIYLIRKVIELLEKQIENNSICLSGFYMYKDLEQFFMYETKDYNNVIFEQTYQYTRNLRYHLEYKYGNKKNSKFHQEYSLKYETMHQYALNQMKFVNHLDLLEKYETYVKVRRYIKQDRIILRVIKQDYTDNCYIFEKVHRDFNEDRSFTLLRTGKAYTFNAKAFGVYGTSKAYGYNRFAIKMENDYYLKEGDIFYSDTDAVNELLKEHRKFIDELLKEDKEE